MNKNNNSEFLWKGFSLLFPDNSLKVNKINRGPQELGIYFPYDLFMDLDIARISPEELVIAFILKTNAPEVLRLVLELVYQEHLERSDIPGYLITEFREKIDKIIINNGA